MIGRNKALPLILLTAAALAGCAAPTATIDLMTVARKGIAYSQEAQSQQHAEILRRMADQAAALDAAFDADVRLVAAGQVKDAQGRPVELSPEWVISARKGYVAARGLLEKQMRSQELANAKQQENLVAADEALEMACQLIVQRWNVGQRVKQQLLKMQRRLVNER